MPFEPTYVHNANADDPRVCDNEGHPYDPDTLSATATKLNDMQDDLVAALLTGTGTGCGADYQKRALTGGGGDALDGIDGDELTDGKIALAVVGSNPAAIYHYVLDADNGGASNPPYCIPPTTNAGTKRWILAARIPRWWPGGAAPIGSNDESHGVQIGDMWAYQGNVWICTDNTTNGALWLKILQIGTTAGTACAGNDARLGDARPPTAHGATAHSGTIGGEDQIGFSSATGHAHSGADSKAVDHANLQNKGTNTHAQIDTQLASLAGNLGSVPVINSNIQRLILQLSMVGNIAVGTMSGGVFDHFEDTTGIDGTNSVATRVSEHYTPVEAASGLTTDSDITTIGTTTGTALIRDIKASITTWTKDSTARGHFDVANAAVVAGCIVTFADASTATIEEKNGDGTGTNSLLLSADHATDAALASITNLTFSTPNLTIPTGTIVENSFGNAATAAMTVPSGSNTLVNCLETVPNNALISQFDFYSTTSSGSGKIKLVKVNGGTYDVVNLVTFTKTVAGTQTIPVTPYLVPASGTYYIGAYMDSTLTGDGTASCAQALTGGSQLAGGDSSTGVTISAMDVHDYRVAIKTYYLTQGACSSLFAAHTNTAQLTTTSYTAITNVTATQALNGTSKIWHAASFNKGGGTETWWVYLSSAWRSIVALTSGTWQYRDAGGTLQNASTNSRLGALVQAFGVAQNQMSATALTAITSGQWSTQFAAGTFDMACGLQSDGTNVPTLDKWTVTYNQAGQNMALISAAATIPVTITKASATVLIKNYHASAKISVATANTPSYTEVTGLTKVASSVGGTGIDQYATGDVSVSGSAGQEPTVEGRDGRGAFM